MKKLMTAILFFSSITTASEKEHELLMATLYVQSSAEFYANSKTIYEAAKNDLQNLLKDTNHTAALEQSGNYSKKPPAIILDVDRPNSVRQQCLSGKNY